MIRALLLLAWLASPSDAAVLRLDSFDAVTGDAAANNKDVFGYTETTTDANVRPQSTTTHNAKNGGTDSSKWALRVNVASGASGYYSLDATVATNILVVGASLHAPVQTLTTSRRNLTIRESARDGCSVDLNAARTLTLKYNGSTLGTTGEALQARVCCIDNTTDPTQCSPRDECASDADCGTGRQCGIGNVGADLGTCAADGGGCYWGGVKLGQVYTSTTQVECQLSLDGRASLTPGVTATTGATPPQDVWIGASGTEAQALDLYVDDLVLATTLAEVGFGYVMAGVPNADGTANTWTTNSCGAGTLHARCVDDFLSGASFDDASQLRISNAAKTEHFASKTPTWTISSGESIKAVEYVLLGTTNAAGATQDTYLTVGTLGKPPVNLVAPDLSSPGIYGRTTWTTAPNASGGSTAWSTASANQVGVKITTTNGTTRQLSAVIFHVQVVKPDEPLPITLADHNVGTDDGLMSLFTAGDSTNGGTLASTCPSGPDVGELCSQQDYCSWESETKDRPVGGCNGSDAACITCTARRTETANGAGYACAAPSDCECPAGNCTGLCSSGVCTNNTQVAVSCTVDADCNLGTCDTTATCIDSCEDADCPTRTAWGAFLAGRIGADVIARCFKGGESSAELVANRLASIVSGSDVSCVAEVGTGVCACSVNADCGPIGTCTAGSCTGTSLASRLACRDPVTDCATGFACRLAPPDYLLVWTGNNDSAFVQGTPNCDGPLAAVASGADQGFPLYGGECDLCADTYCKADADCSGLSADSQCFGFIEGSGGEQKGCLAIGRNGGCTTYTFACRDNGDCPSGLTCTGGDADHWLARGVCTCSTTGNCETATGGTAYSCVNTVCRLECATDADCGGLAGSCTSGTCKGRCTCPSNARSCTTNADCVGVTSTRLGFTRTFEGTCNTVAGACECMGPDRCRVDDECPDAHRHFYAGATHTGVVIQLHAIADYLAGLAESDGRPLLVANTLPQPDSPAECWEPATGAPGQNIYADWGYFRRSRHHIREELPVVVDAWLALFNQPGTHSDIIHPNATGADLIGRANVQVLKTLGTCTTQDARGEPLAQTYCRNTTGTWETATCDAAADCNSDESCQIRRCGCECRTNQDCVNWFGTGHTCDDHDSNSSTPKICRKSGTDACVSFGVGYTCTSGQCMNGGTDACPGANDTCNVES